MRGYNDKGYYDYGYYEIIPACVRRIAYLSVEQHDKYAKDGDMEFTLSMKALYYYFYGWQRPREKGETLCCSQSIPTLVKELQISQSTINRDIAKLKWAGILEVSTGMKTKQGSPTNKFKVIHPRDVERLSKDFKEKAPKEEFLAEESVDLQEEIDYSIYEEYLQIEGMHEK